MKERYNLSGIYIFDKLNDEEKQMPTCIEDCNEDTRTNWLQSLDKEALIKCCEMLCLTLREIGKQEGIRRI